MEGVVSIVILSMDLQWIFKGPDCKPSENEELDNLQASA